ncbi:TniQ family protein [Stenotrophomonas maltophilia]
MAGTRSLGQSEIFPFHRGVLPVDGELLSSYLLRLASAHSADHYRFYSTLLPRAQIWNRDIDRAINERVTNLLVERCELSIDAANDLSLRAYESLISGGGARQPSGHGMWINSVGVYHRTRTLAGLQVCPVCISKERIYKRVWRLSFVTCCPEHLSALCSVCPGCSAPIVPHRQLAGTTTCHSCHVDYFANFRTAASPRQIPPGQRMLMNALGGEEIPTLSDSIPLQDLARGLALLRRWGMLRLPLGVQGPPVESQGPITREIYFDLVHELVSNWPESMGLLMVRGRISRGSFENAQPPEWMSCIAGQLSARVSSVAKVRGDRSLSSWLRELRASKPEGWRATRAAVLAKEAMK